MKPTKFILSLLCSTSLFFSCNSDNKQLAESKAQTDDEIFTNLFTEYPELYPYRYDTNSHHSGVYFYQVYREVKSGKDYIDSIDYRVFTGFEGGGQHFNILIFTYQNKQFVIPFDIEVGSKEGLEMLNKAFTNFYQQISQNLEYRSKKHQAVLIIDKILTEFIGLKYISNPQFVYHFEEGSYNQLLNKKSLERQEELRQKKLEYNNFCDNIKDSLFDFWDNDYARRLDKYEKEKYMLYMDIRHQVLVVSVSDNQVTFQFFNPLNYIHIFI